MEEDILKKIFEKVNKGETVAMATISNVCGSSPARVGAIMAIFKDKSTLGSIGGGSLEFNVMKEALDCIENKKNKEFKYKLDDNGNLDMKCGGSVNGFIKVFFPNPKIIIIGAGHIAYNLNKLANFIGMETIVIDDREEFANKNRFNSNQIIVSNIKDALENFSFNNQSYVVIVTRGHKDDALALELIINKNPAYIGMIGSKKKVSFTFEELFKKGISKNKLDNVYSPIGLNIATEKPEEIALSIISEIVLLKNKGSLSHCKNNIDNYLKEA